jgi:hypothetical protein
VQLVANIIKSEGNKAYECSNPCLEQLKSRSERSDMRFEHSNTPLERSTCWLE